VSCSESLSEETLAVPAYHVSAEVIPGLMGALFLKIPVRETRGPPEIHGSYPPVPFNFQEEMEGMLRWTLENLSIP